MMKPGRCTTTLYVCIGYDNNLVACYKTMSLNWNNTQLKYRWRHFWKVWRVGSVVCDWAQLPLFIPQVPLTHPDYPLNGEFGKVSSLEQSHEDGGQNGDGAPGISCHYLLGKKKKTCFTAFTGGWNKAMKNPPFYSVVCKGPATGTQQKKAGWSAPTEGGARWISPPPSGRSSTNQRIQPNSKPRSGDVCPGG